MIITRGIVRIYFQNAEGRQATVLFGHPGSMLGVVNGVRYAWNVLKVSLAARLHQKSIFFKRQFDIYTPEQRYPFKSGYTSSHTMAIDRVPAGSAVLDIGCGLGYVGRELEKKRCDVQGIDSAPDRGTPVPRFGVIAAR